MRITETDRQAAREERERGKTTMSEAARLALGRGSCHDCALPWDCVAVGGHIPAGAKDWRCGRCFRLMVETRRNSLRGRLRPSKLAKQLVWNQGAGVAQNRRMGETTNV